MPDKTDQLPNEVPCCRCGALYPIEEMLEAVGEISDFGDKAYICEECQIQHGEELLDA